MSGAPTRQEIEKAVLDSINELIVEFRASPYFFLYESDLQSVLFVKLRRRLPGSVGIARSGKGPAYRLSWVYTEYNKRVDVAILDPERIHEAPIAPHKGFDTYIYDVPLLVGIELKYRKMGDRFSFASCIADLEKLRSHPKMITIPCVIAFLQEHARANKFLTHSLGDSNTPARIVRDVQRVSDLDAAYVVTPEAVLRISEP